LGPDGPVDADVVRTVTGPAGVSITPNDERLTTEAGVAVSASRSLTDSWTVTCQTGGVQALTVTTSVTPTRAKVVDPVSTNDTSTTTVNVDCAIPVTINVQPGSTRNPVNLSGTVLPVAILSTGAGEYGNPTAFNATQIDPATLRFGSRTGLLAGNGVVESHGAIHPEDSLELDERRRDRDVDSLTHFRPRQDAIGLSDTQGCVFGRAGSASIAFFGCDRVTVLK
jgi:hypothetical protein